MSSDVHRLFGREQFCLKQAANLGIAESTRPEPGYDATHFHGGASQRIGDLRPALLIDDESPGALSQFNDSFSRQVRVRLDHGVRADN